MRSVMVCLLLVVSCGRPERDGRTDAMVIYARVKHGEMSDSAGKAHFRKISVSQAFRLSANFRDHLGELELHSRNPEKHYEAKCIHDLGVCKIMEEMENTREVYIYMIQARTP